MKVTQGAESNGYHLKTSYTFMQNALRASATAGLWLSLCVACGSQESGWPSALQHAKQLAPEARIIVLDIPTGHLLATQRREEAPHTLAAPGSTLKPLVLYSLIAASRWRPGNRVSCDRQLKIAGHRLQCTHPLAPPYDASAALTWSCNSYFAEVSRAIPPGELGSIFKRTGILSATGLANEETAADFKEPHTLEETQLTVLGVKNVRVSPLQLAIAYRWLALELAAHPDSAAAQVVQGGTEDSATFGMAAQVRFGGASVAGKTGTAEGAVSSQTHGWFAGMAPAKNPRIVVVVYLPAGRGADAARVAGELLAHAPLEQP